MNISSYYGAYNINYNTPQFKAKNCAKIIKAPTAKRYIPKLLAVLLPLSLLQCANNVDSRTNGETKGKNYNIEYLRYTLDMDEKQSEIYRSVERDMEYGEDIDCINGLVQLTRLQQICIDPSGLVASYDLVAPKINWALNFIKKASAKGYKGIVMAKKLQPLKNLAARLDEVGIKYVRIDGSKSMSERKEAERDFCNASDIPIILRQLDAGRESLTLSPAKYTFFFDRDFAQGFNEQAEARMTPIDGNPITKYVIDVVMRGTREEEIYDTLVIRKQNINTINDVFKKSARKEDS